MFVDNRLPGNEERCLDGEIVYFGSDGRPEFYSLIRRRGPQYFCVFDVLWLDGKDLRGSPLVRRKEILRRVAPQQPAPVLFVEHFEERGTDLYRAVCDMDLEGIVPQRKDGLYTPEETSWVKIKNPKYSQIEGRRELFERRAVQA